MRFRNNMFDKLKKKLTRGPKPREVIVSSALEKIKVIIGKVKKASYSDFEYLKREIELMLSQPEKF